MINIYDEVMKNVSNLVVIIVLFTMYIEHYRRSVVFFTYYYNYYSYTFSPLPCVSYIDLVLYRC